MKFNAKAFVFLLLLLLLFLQTGILVTEQDYKSILTVLLAIPGIIALWVSLSSGPSVQVTHVFANPISEQVAGQNYDERNGFRLQLITQNSGDKMTTIKSAILHLEGTTKSFSPENYNDARLFDRSQSLDTLACGEAKALRFIFNDNELREVKPETRGTIKLSFVKHKDVTVPFTVGPLEFHDQYADLIP